MNTALFINSSGMRSTSNTNLTPPLLPPKPPSVGKQLMNLSIDDSKIVASNNDEMMSMIIPPSPISPFMVADANNNSLSKVKKINQYFNAFYFTKMVHTPMWHECFSAKKKKIT